MKRSASIGLGIALLLAACGQDEPKPNTDDPQYKLGYQAGQADEETALCSQIEDYKDSIAQALKEANICPG